MSLGSEHREMRQPQLAWESSHRQVELLEVLLLFRSSTYHPVENSLPLVPLLSCPRFEERGWKGQPVLAGSSRLLRQGGGAWLIPDGLGWPCWSGTNGGHPIPSPYPSQLQWGTSHPITAFQQFQWGTSHPRIPSPHPIPTSHPCIPSPHPIPSSHPCIPLCIPSPHPIHLPPQPLPSQGPSGAVLFFGESR